MIIYTADQPQPEKYDNSAFIVICRVAGERLFIRRCPAQPDHEAGRSHDADTAPTVHSQPGVGLKKETHHPDFLL